MIKLCFQTCRSLSGRKKKRRFCRVIQQLGLDGCQVVADRVESAGEPQSYDAVLPERGWVAHAVGIRGASTGRWRKAYFYNGTKYPEEIEKSERARRILGWESPEILPYTFTYKGELYRHWLLVYRKDMETPERFPRRLGAAAKEPL